MFLYLPCEAFYLPGIAPIDYEYGDDLEVKVRFKRPVNVQGLLFGFVGRNWAFVSTSNCQAVKMTSVKAQLPYEYYTLPFCQPSKLVYKPENLGKTHIIFSFLLCCDSILYYYLKVTVT